MAPVIAFPKSCRLRVCVEPGEGPLSTLYRWGSSQLQTTMVWIRGGRGQSCLILLYTLMEIDGSAF